MWPEGLARPTTANIKVFTPGSTSHWQTWNKPVGCTFVYILACGGGGAGGKNTGANQTVGAGGGGSGLLGRAIFPGFMLPDTLYFRIGNGGATTTVAGTGNSGTETAVSVATDSTAVASNILLRCQGGSGGGGAATNTAGAGGATVTSTNQILSALGFWQIASRNGTAGAAASNGSGTALTVQGGGLIVMGGTGGGNGTGSGGNITVITEFKTWVAMSGGAVRTNGQSAINNTTLLLNALTSNQPIVFQGGTGGGGTNVAGAGSAAGNGGAGSWGCGGGGGGNSNINSGVSGNGGAGGDGFAIVIAF